MKKNVTKRHSFEEFAKGEFFRDGEFSYKLKKVIPRQSRQDNLFLL